MMKRFITLGGILVVSILFWVTVGYFFLYSVGQAKEEESPKVYSAINELGFDINMKAKEIFKITVYTPYSDGEKWGYRTTTGIESRHLATCAVDPRVISMGSVVNVNGLELVAVDTGSKVKGNVVDIFYDGTEEQARKWVAEFGTSHIVEVK